MLRLVQSRQTLSIIVEGWGSFVIFIKYFENKYYNGERLYIATKILQAILVPFDAFTILPSGYDFYFHLLKLLLYTGALRP